MRPGRAGEVGADHLDLLLHVTGDTDLGRHAIEADPSTP